MIRVSDWQKRPPTILRGGGRDRWVGGWGHFLCTSASAALHSSCPLLCTEVVGEAVQCWQRGRGGRGEAQYLLIPLSAPAQEERSKGGMHCKYSDMQYKNTQICAVTKFHCTNPQYTNTQIQNTQIHNSPDYIVDCRVQFGGAKASEPKEG